MKIELNSVWRPVNSHTGCGIILKINEVPEHRKHMYSSDENFDGKLYHFITDFGNVCVYTKEQILGGYEYIYTEENPKERLIQQLRLLREVEDDYLNGGDL